MYFLPPRVALNKKNGAKNDIASIGIIHALFEKRSPVLTKLKMASKTIINSESVAVPDIEYIISAKKSLIFLSNSKHLAFCNNHIKWDIVFFVQDLTKQKGRV